VLVGALFVGSMSTIWHGEVTPRRPRRRCDLPLDGARAPLALARGAEVARFNMGSTVIMLLPPGSGSWLTGLVPGSPVRLGQALATLA
jgi:phosphatidylserine decarboxylase